MGITVIKKDGGSGGGSTDWGDIGGTLADQTDLQSALDSAGGGSINLVDWSGYQASASSSYFEFAKATLTSGKKYTVTWVTNFDTNNTTPSYIDLLFRTSASPTNSVGAMTVLIQGDVVLDNRVGFDSIDAINGTTTIPSQGGHISGSMYVDLSEVGSDVDFTVDGRVGSGTLVLNRIIITAIEVVE